MSHGVRSPGRAQIEQKTLRQDRWWVYPAVTFTVFAAFVVYATVRAFSGHHYYAAPYLSPFYSPCLTTSCVEGSSDFGQPFSWWQLSPALIILIFPLGFRMSCYYYRKAYYRSFWLSPPACGVAEPHGKYSGETRLPLILSYDVVISFKDENGEWGHMGLGTLVLLVNVLLIWAYTLGCHSCRHAVGGRLRHFSKHPLRYRAWTLVSRLNASHARYAWLSLFSVAIADLYVYLLAVGAFSDPRFF